MKWWPRYAGDFGSKTRHLSLVEKGAYSELLDHYYTTESPLPSELEALFRIAGARGQDEERAVRRIASEFFPVTADGKRHNARADEEIAKSQAISEGAKSRWKDVPPEERSAAGKKAAKARWDKDK